MPKTTTTKSAPVRKTAAANRSDAAAAAAASRGERRKRETRARLMRAALRLAAHRGVDAVVINEITEEADVGFGSFYNHFPSKDAIYEELVSTVLDRFGETLDLMSAQITDPAEKIAASVRYTMLRARKDPEWGRFLVRVSLAGGSANRGLGQFLWRDLQAGVASGRLKADDVALTYVALGGTVLGAMTADFDTEAQSTKKRAGGKAFVLDEKALPERTAALLLRMLGLSAKEADSIARRPLPEVAWPESAL